MIFFDKLNSIPFFHYFLKRKTNQLFLSVAIRNFALGMINIFVPIYIYQHFDSISLTLLFFAIYKGLFGALVPFGGQLMKKIGVKHAMLFSCPFIFGFYLSLLCFEKSILFVFLAIILSVLNAIFFWPSYHTYFARFVGKNHLGREVGKLSFSGALPGILAPVIGGGVITFFGYPILFMIVLFILFVSALPLFLSKEVYQIYTDSYLKAYRRITKPENKYNNLAFAANGMEGEINAYLWPLFLAILSIGYISIGGITTIASLASLFFILFVGRITDTLSRAKLITIGSVLTSLTWIGKFFVVNPFLAFFAQSAYRFARTAASIPFQTIFYEKAKNKGSELDEFIVYRDIIQGISRCFLLLTLAGVFLVVPQINFAFILGAILCLGFIFLTKSVQPDVKALYKNFGSLE